jgi:phage shock protein PspC (stress-responsive transcriptional regulator)
LTAIFPMLLFYVIAWIIIPVREEIEQIRKQQKSNNKK